MKKLVLFVLIILMAVPSFSLPVLDSLYANIKDQALASLKDTFNRPIKIREASGVVLGQIVLNDVSVGEELHFNKFIINFNPLSYAYHKGDIMPSISEIVLEGGWAKAHRNKSGILNLADILKTGEGGGPPFKSKISFEGLKIFFKDDAGMPYNHKAVYADILNASGQVNLNKFPKISLQAKAETQDNGSIDIGGSLDAKKGKYDLTVFAKKMKASTFGNYFTPMMDFKDGFADVSAVIKTNEIKLNVDGIIDGVDVTVNGKVFDSLDLKIALKNAQITTLRSLVPSLADIDLSGKADANLKISGPYNDIQIAADTDIVDGKYSGQKFSGSTSMVFAKNKLIINQSDISAYKGTANVVGDVSFLEKIPTFALTGKFVGLDIPEFVQNAPGFAGRINGQFTASGNIEKSNTDLSGTFSQAEIFGQPLKTFLGNLNYEKGRLIFENIKLASDKSEFIGSGTMSPQKEFSLKANVSGIKLKGEGFAGPMEIGVDKFLGDLAFKLDEKFISAPLRNLSANGSIEVSNGLIGDQKISKGSGSVIVDQGKINYANMQFYEGGSVLSVSANGTVSDLYLSTELSGKELLIGNDLVKQLLIKAHFVDNKLFLDDFYVKTDRSELSGYLKKDQARFTGNIDMNDISFLTSQYGAIYGSGWMDFWMSGDLGVGSSNLTLDLKNPGFNNVQLDRLSGSIGSNGGTLKISNPVILAFGKNQLSISGNSIMDFEDLSQSSLNAKTVLSKGNIKEVLKFGMSVYREVDRLLKPVLESRAYLDPSKIKLPDPKTGQILHDKEGTFSFKDWDKANLELLHYKKLGEPVVLGAANGEISAQAEITGTINSPKAKVTATVNKGSYGKYNFTKLSTAMEISSEALKINKCDIEKQGGIMSLTGTFGFASQEVDLRLSAKDMPIDVFKLAIDKEFQGSFMGNAAIKGPASDPSFSAWFKSGKIKVAGVDFDQSSGAIEHSPNYFALKNMTLLNGSAKSTLNGEFSLDGDFMLSATLEGKSLGLMNLFTDQVRFLNGSSIGTLSIQKNKDTFSTGGHIAIKDLLVNIPSAGSDLSQCMMDVSFEGSYVTVNKLTGYWYGKQGKPTPLSIAGTTDINKQTLSFRSNDGTYSVDIADFYRGDITFRELSLSGRYSAPELSGIVDLNNGILYLPGSSAGGGEGQSQPKLGLNLELNIPRNVYLAVGNLNTIDLSNIFMNLEMTGQRLRISGDSGNPSIIGKIYFKRGTINIFNREFTLLDQISQRGIYPNNPDKLTENYADFFGGSYPRLQLKAKVLVEDMSAVRKNVMIISHLTGIPQSTDKANVLNINFEALDEDRSTMPVSYKVANYSEDQVKVLLLPDFLKSAMGINGSTPIESNAVVADYLNSRLQTFVFRGVERELEKNLGLESLTLEYNFGPDLRRALGAKDTSQAQLQTQGFGVGFVKGLFDRFFISVKYAQLTGDSTINETQTYINYQLTYKLTQVLSISYYREPISLNDIVSGYYKTTLNAQFTF